MYLVLYQSFQVLTLALLINRNVVFIRDCSVFLNFSRSLSIMIVSFLHLTTVASIKKILPQGSAFPACTNEFQHASHCKCAAVALQPLGHINHVEVLLQRALLFHSNQLQCRVRCNCASIALHLRCRNLGLFSSSANALQKHIPFQQHCNSAAFVLPKFYHYAVQLWADQEGAGSSQIFKPGRRRNISN